MLWFIIAAAVTIALIVIFWGDIYDGAEVAVIGSAAAFFLAFAFNVAFINGDTKEYQSKPHTIANIQDGSEVHGSFFLGIGGIGEDMKYSFYGEASKGVYELKTVDAEHAKVTFTDEEPYYTYTCYRDETPNWLTVFSDGWCDEDEITFHVPEGSIKTEFKLDAK